MFSKLTLLLVILFGLPACQSQKTSEAVFDNYLYRLKNSLRVKQQDPFNPVLLAKYPKKPDIVHSIPRIDVNILQFLQLSQCELQRLIGHRNSSLGKLMGGFHSLLYEYEFLVLAERCQSRHKDNAGLSSLLEEAISHKKTYAKQLFWNAIFADEDVRKLFSTASMTLKPEQLDHKPSELIGALEYLHHWLTQPALDTEKLEYTFQTLARGKYIGALRLTMNLAVQRLASADALINQRLAGKPLCFDKKPNPQFEIVNTVFQRFYISETQYLVAKLHQQANELLPLIDQIQNDLTPTEAFHKYWQSIYSGEHSEWRRFNRAIKTHTAHWQKLLDQCGRLPGKLAS